LFGTKFEEYLNAKIIKKRGKKELVEDIESDWLDEYVDNVQKGNTPTQVKGESDEDFRKRVNEQYGMES
jgi:hypothetical protein